MAPFLNDGCPEPLTCEVRGEATVGTQKQKRTSITIDSKPSRMQRVSMRAQKHCQGSRDFA